MTSGLIIVGIIGIIYVVWFVFYATKQHIETLQMIEIQEAKRAAVREFADDYLKLVERAKVDTGEVESTTVDTM